jgi:hypothetical protein
VVTLPLAGCGDETAEEKDDHVIVRMSFDEVAYVDQAIQTHKLIERVRHETESIFHGLRRADVMVTAKKQVDVDLGRLDKDPVTVVDPSGITRAAMRIRYHFVGLALVPEALAKQAELPLGVLHTPDATRAELVLSACTANGDAERAAVAELWTVFDPTLPSCADAMEREQAAIDLARKGLEHPEKEIVSGEFERVYLPVIAHLRPRNTKGNAGGPGGPGGPGRKSRDEGRLSDQPGDVIPTRAARSNDDDEDEESLHRMRGGGFAGPVTPNAFNWGGGPALQPNWAVVYFAIASLLLLILGKRRQSGRK